MYKTLNDAVNVSPLMADLAPGTTEVWYQRPELFGQILPINFEADNLEKTHIKVGSIKATDPEYIFRVMQGEEWSPNGEARELIQSLGLGHTSMSMGDVIKTPGNVLFCGMIGWRHYHVTSGA